MICTFGIDFSAGTSTAFSFVSESGVDSLSQSGSSGSSTMSLVSGSGSLLVSYACLSQVTSAQMTVSVFPVPVGDSNRPNLHGPCSFYTQHPVYIKDHTI